MNILLTNDDGIYAEGLRVLYEAFSQKHTVTVIAPDHEKSASSHAITLRFPMRALEVPFRDGYKGYAVSGTPADCIKLALNEIMPARPDMVVSGINPGANVGININYSGTVAAAREAALYGLPAIAIAIQGFQSLLYADTARFAVRLVETVAQKGLPPGTFLNVNVPNLPPAQIAGVRVCSQEIALFDEYVEKRHDPHNRPYYWHGCDLQGNGHDPDRDVGALCLNYITITPIKSDTTDYGMLADLKDWGIELNGSGESP